MVPLPYLVLFLAGLLPAARAHLPHDQVTALLVPPDLDGDVPWFLVVDPVISDLLLRSDDGGWIWETVGGGPTVDRARGGTMLADGTPVILGQQGLWWSTDGGDSWAYEPLDVEPTAIASLGGTVFVGSEEGLTTGPPGALVGAELGGHPVRALHVDGDVLTAALQSGAVLARAADGTWTDLDVPGTGARATAWDAARGVVYASDAAGGVWVHDGEEWRACGALPPLDWPGVFELSVIAGRLLAGTQEGGPFVSEDGCASFEDRRGMFVENTGAGAVDGPDLAVVAMTGVGDTWLVAGWDGLTRTDDAGGSWSERALMPIDYTRSLSFDPDFDETGRVWIGSYAAGPIIALEGGRRYRVTGFGMNRTNTQVVEPAPGGADQVYAIVGHSPWRSRDGGESWEVTNERFVPALDQAVMGPTSLWLSGLNQDPDGSDVVYTGSAGRRWSAFAGVDEALDGSIPAEVDVFAVPGEADRIFVGGTVPTRVIVSADGGASWTVSLEADPELTELTGVVAWPPDAPSRVLVGLGSRVWMSEDWGAGWTGGVDFRPDTVLELVVADDGTIVAGMQSGRLFRSLDGGLGWQDLGIQLSSAVRSLAARPSFSVDDVVLVGTSDGIFAVHGVRGDAPTAERWGAWQILDESAQELICETCPGGEKSLESYPGAAHDQVLRLQPGMVLRTTLRGERIRVVGAIDGTGTATVEVGDPRLPGELRTLGGATVELGELGSVDVAEGWHEVEIRGITGEGIVIDAVEGISDQPALAYAGAGADTGGAGDGGSTGDAGTADAGGGDGGAADGGGGDGGGTRADTGSPASPAACGGCAGAPGRGWWTLLPLAVGLIGRRRR